MNLVRNAKERGLWHAAAATPAGVHALIIGVSSYPHLKGGALPAPNNGGMGQLEVSALTAARIFDWLQTRGGAVGAKVASCRLLLAPRPAELAETDRLTDAWYGSADFATIRAMTEAWGDAIAAGATAGPNVAFFFFSGHGIEHVGSPSMLASDILNPAKVKSSRNALAFKPLPESVLTYGIDHGLFFVDACRNTSSLAKTLDIVGEAVLEAIDDPPKVPNAVMWLRSTRLGAFSHQVAGDRATIFGQALLEALQGLPPQHLPYDRGGDPWRLIFKNMESHVKQRVRELLAVHGATELQVAQPGGDPFDANLLIAEKSPEPVSVAISPTLSPRGLTGLDEMVAAGAVPERTRDQVEDLSSVILKDFTMVTHADLLTSRRSPAFDGAMGDLKSRTLMHDIFGHESITEPWLKQLAIRRDSAKAISVAQGRRREAKDVSTSWIDVTVSAGAGKPLWVQAGGSQHSGMHAVVLPRDGTAFPVRLDLTFRRPGHEGAWQLHAMSARLGPAVSDSCAPFWRHLWEVQRIETLADLAQAAEAVAKLHIVPAALQGSSPLAAAIAACVLIRVGALSALGTWPLELTSRYPQFADGHFLLAEVMMRGVEAQWLGRRSMPATRPSGEAAHKQRFAALASHPDYPKALQAFLTGAAKGTPTLTAVMAMAVRQASRWRQVVEQGMPWAAAAAQRIAGACQQMEQAASYATEDGVFAAYASTDDLAAIQALYEARKVMAWRAPPGTATGSTN